MLRDVLLMGKRTGREDVMSRGGRVARFESLVGFWMDWRALISETSSEGC